MPRALAAACLVLTALAAPAAGGDRDGFFSGFTFGFGAKDCRQCSAFGLSQGGHLGVSLSPRLAVLAEVYVLSQADDGLYAGVTDLVGVVQYWLTRRIWVGGGAGFGGGDRLEGGVAVVAQAGLELVGNESFALDLRARYGLIAPGSGQTAHFAGTVGVTWY